MSEVKGLAELNKQLSQLEKVNPHALLAGAYTLQRYSMENAPVKTGFLRQSHESKETPNGAEMRVNANYAYYVEFGNSKWSGKPYVRPAIDEHGDEIVENVGDEIQKEINKNVH